jgi:deoxyribose-phosphate aldolase
MTPTALKSTAQRVLGLIDLTSLNEDDDAARIAALADSAATAYGPPAALCVYPRWVALAKGLLKERGLKHVKVATVVNFPQGSTDIVATVAATQAALADGADDGADEIDMVFPWRALLAGDAEAGRLMVEATRRSCDRAGRVDGTQRVLKIILESGELDDPQLIRRAAEISIQAGADFIKTSTGKTRRSATLAAAQVMLEAIRARVGAGVGASGKPVGFKASGGIRTVREAAEYLALADAIMGPQWVSSTTFRFGASSLLGDVLAILDGHGHVAGATSSY